MEHQIVDFTKILTKIHEKKWIALSKDNTKVVDFDMSLAELDKRVDHNEVTFMRAPASDVYLNF